jgi:protein-S-isoprenylcysteine O-methyltransferase Ste14
MRLRARLIDLLYRAATGSRRFRTLATVLGALVFFIFITLMILLFLRLDRWWHLPALPGRPWNLIVSLPLLVLGMILAVWSILQFARARGTPVPLNPPARVVRTGPYAYVRNPMLAGGFLQIFGFGILVRSLSLTFLFTPLFVLLNVLELKAIEEPELAKRLGEEYIEYRKQTPMFFPRWKRPRFG